MVNVNSIIGKKNSLRNLSDEYFESIIENLAEDISNMNIEIQYSNEELIKDWYNLIKWKSDGTNINSTSRIGMKLCEHFFPNFYDIQDNKGKSFRNQWTKQNLIKILRWNRKSHSTPYISELKRGVYFCCGMTKNTMYRPQMAKLISDTYNPQIVLDPCAGWGGRMLGVVSSGAKYIAFEPNTETYRNISSLIEFLDISDKVNIINDDVLNIGRYDIPKVNMVITSPPYFDLEVYCNEDSQSITNYSNYESWSESFLRTIIHNGISYLQDNGISCWNVGKVGKKDMNDDVLKYHNEIGFNRLESFSVLSSKRQSNQKDSDKKSSDNTIVYGG